MAEVAIDNRREFATAAALLAKAMQPLADAWIEVEALLGTEATQVRGYLRSGIEGCGKAQEILDRH